MAGMVKEAATVDGWSTGKEERAVAMVEVGLVKW